MSGFRGHMKEYRQISIDRFDKSNLNSTVFLLSHCHRDHMVGLDQQNFLGCLKSRDGVFLYCSAVTKLLLLSEAVFKPLSAYIRVLEIGVATTVTLPDADSDEYKSVVVTLPDPDSDEYKSVLVTALPAGHCPGSVMFLIEGKEGRALYTGDFRWERNYATTLPALCVNGHMKEIDSMYVDTTFCIPEAFYIPSRDDCLSATASLVVAWLRRSPHHYVHVSSRTKYGHEPLLSHLAREAETQVHTSRQKVELYEQISELRGVFTADPSARIHACSWQDERDGGSLLPCGYNPPRGNNSESLEVLVIRPSTMWFTAEPSRLQELVVSPASGRGLHRVCYSFHSSYSELRDLVSLLRPRRVYPNVLPASDSEWSQVNERLQKFLTYQHKHHMTPAGDTITAKPLGLLKRKRTESLNNLSDSEGLVFDSPEKAKQPKQENSEDKGIQPSSQKSYSSNIISPAKSEAHSSYQGSNSEEDMFADSFEGETTLVKQQSEHDSEEGVTAPKGSQSLRSYVSGDEDVPEEDQVSSPQFRHLTSRDDLEVDLDADFHPDDDDGVKESGIINDSGVPRNKKVELGTDPGTVGAAESSVRESGESAPTEGPDAASVEKSDQSELLECPAEAPEKFTEEVRDKDLHPTDSVEESRDSRVEKAVNSKVCLHDSDLDLGNNDEAANRPSEQNAEKTYGLVDNMELESEKENGESEKCSVDNSRRGYVSVENMEKTDSQDGGKLVSENVKGTSDSCGQNVVKGHPENCSLNFDNAEKTETTADCRFESENLSDESDKNLPQGREESKSKEDPKVNRKQSQSKQRTSQVKDSAQFKNTAAEETRGSQSRDTSPTGKNQETNLISSDSDSDVDCKITQSFIKKQHSHPRQIPPGGCSVQGKSPPVQRSPVQHRVSVDSGTMHKLSFKCSPNSKGKSSKVSGAGVNGNKSVAASRAIEAAVTKGSIDVASEEEEESVENPQTEKGEEASLRSDKRVRIEAKKDAYFRRSSLAADDADVEDNDEEDSASEERSSKTLALSAHKNGFFNRNKNSQQFSSDVIVIDDNETSSSSAGKPKSQVRGGAQADRGSNTSASLTTAARQGQQGCNLHVQRSSTAKGGVTVRGRDHSQSRTCSPTKPSAVTEPGHTRCAQTQDSPVKAAVTKPGQTLLQQHGFSPVKHTSCSLSPVKQGHHSRQAGSPAKLTWKQKHEANSTPKKQTPKQSSSIDTSTERASRKEEDCSEDESKERKQTLDKRARRSAEGKDHKELEGEGEDSDATIPPDSPDAAPPTNSPVAVHSSETDSDSDADCKITQSFIKSPQRGDQPSHRSHHPQVVHRPRSGQHHHEKGQHPQISASSDHSRGCRHSHGPQVPQGPVFRPHPQSATHRHVVARPVRPVSATVTSQSDKSKESSFIDLTEEDE